MEYYQIICRTKKKAQSPNRRFAPAGFPAKFKVGSVLRSLVLNR